MTQTLNSKSAGRAPKIGDEAVAKATGKRWDEWFKILDRAGAKKMTHQQIVAILADSHDLGPWWQQMVTVGYEQARGLRELHQKAGGYSISGSRTIGAPVRKLYDAWVDPNLRKRWLGPRENELVIRKATPHKSVRITWCDGRTNLDVNLVAKSPQKSSVAIEHAKLKDAKEAAKMKAYWAKQLDGLKSLLEE